MLKIRSSSQTLKQTQCTTTNEMKKNETNLELRPLPPFWCPRPT